MGVFTIVYLRKKYPIQRTYDFPKYRLLLSVLFSVFMVLVQIWLVFLDGQFKIQIPLQELGRMLLITLVLWGVGLYGGLSLGIRFIRNHP